MADTVEMKLEGFKGLQGALADLATGQGPLADQILATMWAALSVLEQNISDRTPVGATGLLRQSIQPAVYGVPIDLYGEVATNIPYGQPAEYGRAPGKAPVDLVGIGPRGGKVWAAKPALELWVGRVLGLSGQEAADVALALAWRIARRGAKGSHMFTDGFEASKPAIERQFEQLLDDLITQLAVTP